MSIDIKVPSLPESVQDATIVAWHKKPGDAIKRDENLVDVETDKVVLEVLATADGVLKEIIHAEGATVQAQEVIGRMEAGVADATAPTEVVSSHKDQPTAKAETKTTPSQDFAPSVRRALAENNMDPKGITGTGKDGRLTKQDVIQAAAVPKSISSTPVMNAHREERVPMSRLRQRIAERLVEAQHNAALLTTFNEVDLSKVMNLRARYKDAFEKKYGARLGFMSFFTKACIEALKRYPDVNASIDGNDIVYHGFYNIGIAVSTDRGLVVPVLKDADQMNMAEIEANIATFGNKAKSGSLSLDDMTGGTFTITNGGVFGSLLSTPIVNPPQSAILGMHKIQERPVAENGQIVIRPMMYLALSYDHRLIDGKTSVGFLVTIKELLEDPSRMLLEI